ncbi:hypothetical protein N7535_008098 [Penicillium sp. DV-2018c]|nr:hypothetical protein N7461_004134 [Penicillium sp. DV-2018c]KAJ5566460.1 hypothetical protein N7535_008098 [Penicillium sp. DV-2018c]
MSVPAPQTKDIGKLRTSILAAIHDLAADMKYCESLAIKNPENYGRMWAYHIRRKNELLDRIQKVPDVYLRHFLLTTFVNLIE